jgi:Xaa-Pro aminopeptidase
VLRYICELSSEAHMAVMQHIRPGMLESQLESLFQVCLTVL